MGNTSSSTMDDAADKLIGLKINELKDTMILLLNEREDLLVEHSPAWENAAHAMKIINTIVAISKIHKCMFSGMTRDEVSNCLNEKILNFLASTSAHREEVKGFLDFVKSVYDRTNSSSRLPELSEDEEEWAFLDEEDYYDDCLEEYYRSSMPIRRSSISIY